MSDPKTLESAYRQVTQELLDMFLKKHKDYGKGNILSVRELGIALRISEKIERIKHMQANGNKPSNESIEETWIDIANYAVIAILLERGDFESLDVTKEAMDNV